MHGKILAAIISDLIVISLSFNALAQQSQTLIESPQPLSPKINIFLGSTQISTATDHRQFFLGSDSSVFSYYDNGAKQTTGFVGISFNTDYVLSQNYILQAGFEYNYLGSMSSDGASTVGITPATSTSYSYQYKLQIQQILLKTKLLTTHLSSFTHKSFAPYLAVGIGPSFNSFKQFRTMTQSTGSINLTPNFNDSVNLALSYGAEIGIDAKISNKIKLELAYRLMNYGSASPEKGQVNINNVSLPVNFAINSPTIYTSQFLISLHYDLL